MSWYQLLALQAVYLKESEKEPGESCLYRRLKKDYNYGLGRIYTVEEIEKAKQSPGFGREYELQYLGRIGNIFNSSQIDKTIETRRSVQRLTNG